MREELDHDQTALSQPIEKSLQEKLDDELDFPFKLQGATPKIPDRISFIGDRIFAEHRIPRDFVLNHLFKIYNGMIYSMAGNDKEFIYEYCEKNLADRLSKKLDDLSNQGYAVKLPLLSLDLFYVSIGQRSE